MTEGFSCFRVGTVSDNLSGSTATIYSSQRRTEQYSTSKNIYAPDIQALGVRLADVRRKTLRALSPLVEEVGQVNLNHVSRQLYILPGNGREGFRKTAIEGNRIDSRKHNCCRWNISENQVFCIHALPEPAEAARHYIM